jgi:hypothetical protein
MQMALAHLPFPRGQFRGLWSLPTKKSARLAVLSAGLSLFEYVEFVFCGRFSSGLTLQDLGIRFGFSL